MPGLKKQHLLQVVMPRTSPWIRSTEQHLGLVQPIALHYAYRSGQDLDDLIQVGRLGLIKAVKGFRAGDDRPFSAYARPHIRGAILHYLRDQAGLIRLPRRVEEHVQRLRSQGAETLSPADDLVLLQYFNKTHWTELKEHHAETSELPLEEIERQLQRTRAMEALRTLPADEAEAVRAVVLSGQSLREAANHGHVSAMTIQRRLKRGLRRLSRQLKQA